VEQIMKSLLFGCLLTIFAASDAYACFPGVRTFSGQTVDAQMFVAPGGKCDIYFVSPGPTEGTRIDQRPKHGTVTIGEVMRLTYRARAGYVGSDTFVYTRYGHSTRNKRVRRSVRVVVTIE
jgi:hypothetical protein